MSCGSEKDRQGLQSWIFQDQGSEKFAKMSGSNLMPLGGGGSSRFGGGGAGGSSLLNPSYLNPGAMVPHGSEINDRKRPAERESRFDKKVKEESREER